MLALLVWPAALPAQAADADGTRLQLGADTLFVYAIRGADTVPTGRVVDALSVIQVAGGEALQRVYWTSDALLGGGLDTMVDMRASLAPSYFHTRRNRGEARATFARDSAIGYSLLASGDSIEFRSALPPGSINAATFDLVLRASSLDVGRTWNLTGFDASSRTLVPLTAQVVGEEQVEGESCWHIQAAFGGLAVHFWVAKDTRRLRRQVMVLEPDLRVLFSSTPPEAPTAGRKT
jgi:hypothetical protein